ncbi:flavin reductase family protein [Caulobacter sp. RL271]|jgi:flavin reductase (DIM6/NTAB) family NADH-FMN oxidoreductase RutF|uniref:Flavin reductase family protein n=1 Tax=Caulobacter segnis TaxID=88688 RepID=A0ABY4ZQY7_9CAUL|nr:flavin reductase family protein [Caulobacter segnis]USQ94437.1 flavin reductase family protein [Caulobacter segnis]
MSAAIQPSAPEPADFRKAMGSFPAGVTVVTACHDGRLVGTTVSAFSSVSMDPPLVMVCLKRDSRTLAALSQARTFCVNILAQDQGDLAYRFAKSGADDRFALTAVEAGVCGAPLLAGSVTSVECEVRAAHDGGDHEILVGRVLRVVTDETKTPLVYVRGGFLNA